MGLEKQQTFKEKNWISLTAYRTLFVLKLLIEKPRTLEEIVQELKTNKNTQKSLSKDTVRITLKTLKAAGCIFSKVNKTNNYKYELLSHPFGLKFSLEELSSLLKLRNKLSDSLSLREIFLLNDLYEKIIMLTGDEEQIELVNSSKPLLGVNNNILKQLSSSKLYGKKIKISYYSPTNGDEKIDIVVGKISFDDGKLYLHCYNYKYKSYSLLNIERIKGIDAIYLSESIEQNYLYEVIYNLFGESKNNFEKKDFETVITTDEDSITVKALVSNEFCFIQRLLLFGADFKIVSPDSFREKLISKIKSIQKGYSNEQI